MGNFFRAIGAGAVDIDTQADQLINKTFWSDVTVDEYQGKKKNQIVPWSFHATKDGTAPLPKSTSTPPSKSSGASSGSSDFDPSVYEDDIPF